MFSLAKKRSQQKERIANIAKTNPTRHSQIERYFESGSSLVLLAGARAGAAGMRKKVTHGGNRDIDKTSRQQTHVLWLPRADNIRQPTRENFLKHAYTQKHLGRVLIGSNRQRLGKITVVQLFLDLINFAFFDEEEIGIQLRGIIVVLIVTDLREVAQNPGQGIWTGTNDMADQVVESRVPVRQFQ